MIDAVVRADMYARVASRFQELTEISGRVIDDEGLRALGMVSNPCLTSIAFKYSLSIKAISITRLCKSSPLLKTLLPPCEQSDLTDESVSSIAKYCPGIEHLSLAGWAKITDASITSLSALIALKDLNLSDCSGLTSAGVQRLLRSRGANLEALTLSYPYYLTDTISCSFCDAALLHCIGGCCPNLREFAVRIGAESNVTEASLISLVQGCPLLSTFCLWCDTLTDAFLFQLSERCPRLSKLNLWDGNYTDAGVLAVTSHCPALVELELINLVNLTDQSLLSIAKHCKRLRTLGLWINDHYTDRGLCHLFASCTELTDAQLINLSRMTDRSVLALVQSCRGLTCLALQADLVLTEEVVAYLDTLHELHILALSVPFPMPPSSL